MKRRIIAVVSVAAVLAVSMFAVHAVAKETAAQVDKTTPAKSIAMPMMSGGPQEMMQKAGIEPEMMQRCQVMMQTPIFIDSPCAIYGQANVLDLSEKQKEQLIDIENEARKKALAVLTDEQKKKMGDIPDKPMAMAQMCQQMCSKMMPMMQKMMSGTGKSRPMMMCPMMKMMGDKDQEGSMMCSQIQKPSKSNDVQTKSSEQETCPVMGGPIKKDIYTEYKGRKVYFCCQKCKGKFEANPEKYIAKLPQFRD